MTSSLNMKGNKIVVLCVIFIAKIVMLLSSVSFTVLS